MAIFRRSKGKQANAAALNDGNRSDAGSSADIPEKKPFSQRKPANTAFKQQRLKAWQPILTPKTVLPTFFLVGLIFAPIGAVLYYFGSQVTDITIDYTDCMNQGTSLSTIPESKYTYNTVGAAEYAWAPPQWQYVANTSAPNGFACEIFFNVPTTLKPSVFLYYKMTNYYQNHRRYVKSIDTNQLIGDTRTPNQLQSGSCKPLGSQDGKGIYPCGLIANSVFNDTIFDPILLNAPASSNTTTRRQVQNADQTYVMSEKNIIWPGEKQKYKKTTQDPTTLIPPPYWRGNHPGQPYSWPNNYSVGNIYDPSEDEHFMVWMSVAGLPTFRKLYKRNDNDEMLSGRYSITIFDNYPVSMFHGTKSIVISTVSWVGGRSLFLGGAYIAAAALAVLLGLIFTARHLIRPRKLGDLSLLSWNE